MDDVAGHGREVFLESGYEGDGVYFEVLRAGSEEGGVVGVIVRRDVWQRGFGGIEFSVESQNGRRLVS